MKKILVGILIVVPLLVVLMVGLVTTFVSVRAYIGVEGIEFDKQTLGLELQEGLYRLEDLPLTVTVYPEKATDKTYTWSLRNVHSRDPEYPDSENGKDGFWYASILDADKQPASEVTGGYLDVRIHCSFELVVTAETYSASCFVTVGGDVENVTAVCDDTDLTVGESVKADAVLTPLDSSLADIRWTSSDDTVATVDRNGIITAVGAGEADVKLEVKSLTGVWIEAAQQLHITVSPAYTVFGNTVRTHLKAMTLDELGMSVSVIESTEGCKVSDGILTIDEGSDHAVVNTTDGGRVEFYVCGEYDIEIVGADILGGDNVLETGGLPVYLTARYVSVFKQKETFNVQWGSNDENVVSIDQNGIVNIVNSGNATVTAVAETLEGYKNATVDLQVRRKVAVLISGITDESLQVGLARETVVASMKYDENGSLVGNTFPVTLAFPLRAEGESEEAFYDSFTFTTNLPEYAYFDTEEGNGINNNLLMFNNEALSKVDGPVVITVTVKAKYPKYPNLPSYTTASFKLKIVSGVQVYNHPDMRKALEAGYDVCLGSNIKLVSVVDSSGKASAPTINAKGNLYGNGFIVSAEKDQLDTATRPIINSSANDLVFSNVTLRANTLDGDIDAIEASTFTVGYAFNFRQSSANNQRITGNRVEYCILENCRTIADLKGADVEFEGCIMRNTSGVGIYVDTRMNGSTLWYNNLTMTNCIMSNMIGSAMNFGYAKYSESNYNNMPHTTFTQKGFLDIYNWQPVDNCVLIPDDVLEEAGLPADLIKTTLQQVIRSSEFLNAYKKEYNGEVNIHFGFISLGLSNKSYIINDITMEDKRFKTFNTNQIDSDLLDMAFNIVPSLKQNPIYVWCYDASETELVPGHIYVVNSKTIDRLHGAL